MREIWAISDIHGHFEKFVSLLQSIGILDAEGNIYPEGTHDKKVILLGDYIDKGEKPLETLELVMTLEAHGLTEAVLLGNHDFWLLRYLRDKAPVEMKPEKVDTLRYIRTSPMYNDFTEEDIKNFLNDLPLFHKLDQFRFAHAYYDGKSARQEKKKQKHMLYGPSTGKTLENGFPERIHWFETRDKETTVIFGHYSLDTKISKFKSAVCTDCSVFKEGGRLGAYEIFSEEEKYVD